MRKFFALSCLGQKSRPFGTSATAYPTGRIEPQNFTRRNVETTTDFSSRVMFLCVEIMVALTGTESLALCSFRFCLSKRRIQKDLVIERELAINIK